MKILAPPSNTGDTLLLVQRIHTCRGISRTGLGDGAVWRAGSQFAGEAGTGGSWPGRAGVAGRRGGALRSHSWGANRTTADAGDPAAHRRRALGASDVPAVVWPHYLTRSL